MNELESREDTKQSEIRNPKFEIAFYLFCFARSDRLSVVEGTGVDGQHPLFLWRFLDITAVLSMASLEEFCGPSADLRMQDLTWVGPRACRHEQVIEHVMRHSPVLPARFGTLFSSLESLENFLKKHHGVILDFWDRIADKEEWAIKGLLDRARAREDLLSAILGTLEPSISCLPPGVRYLQEQQIRGEVEKELNCWLKETCIAIATDLSRYASDSCERRALSVDEAGRAREVVLNWAFLATRSVVGDVRARIGRANAEHAERGLFFELSGPWPPYSFCPRSLTEPVA